MTILQSINTNPLKDREYKCLVNYMKLYIKSIRGDLGYERQISVVELLLSTTLYQYYKRITSLDAAAINGVVYDHLLSVIFHLW